MNTSDYNVYERNLDKHKILQVRKQVSRFQKTVGVGKREGTTYVRRRILCGIGASDRLWRKRFPSGFK